MPFKEVRELLAQVITSWQVLVVTIVVILYFSLVSYVADLYRRPRSPRMPKSERPKRPSLIRRRRKKDSGTASANVELGLEED